MVRSHGPVFPRYLAGSRRATHPLRAGRRQSFAWFLTASSMQHYSTADWLQKLPWCFMAHLSLSQWAAPTSLLLNIRHFWDSTENLAKLGTCLSYPYAMDKCSTKPSPKAHLKLVPEKQPYAQDILTVPTQQKIYVEWCIHQELSAQLGNTYH